MVDVAIHSVCPSLLISLRKNSQDAAYRKGGSDATRPIVESVRTLELVLRPSSKTAHRIVQHDVVSIEQA